MTSVLEPSNVGRNWLVSVFHNQIATQLRKKDHIRVGIVGGTKSEPEIREISKYATQLEISTLGIDNSDYFLDLNDRDNNIQGVHFDLVLCSQVLEHVWNHKNAFDSLYDLVAPQGILWINAPASNRAHGSPDYYSAGFTCGYLENNLRLAGFDIISSGSVGSKRNYLATHSLPYWLSVRSHRFPLIYIRHNTGKVKNLYFLVRYFFILLRLQFTSPRVQNVGQHLTESWAIAKRDT
jgi:SAM-dependent methyltransferase